MKIKKVTWNEINELIDDLSKHIKPLNKKYITGPQRGGLVPAVMLSHRCNLEFVNLTSILDESLDIPLNELIIVDDICDSGETFESLNRAFQYFETTPPITFISLFRRKGSEFKPHYYANVENSTDWILFPWEKDLE